MSSVKLVLNIMIYYGPITKDAEMGAEVQTTQFTEEHIKEFQNRLHKETNILLNWFQNHAFEKNNPPMCGMEMEAWLVDKNFNPLPKADTFIETLKEDLVVPEIAKFNFELNSPPQRFETNVLNKLHTGISDTWKRCEEHAKSMDARTIIIGSLPTLGKDMLELDYLYPSKRYHALNNRILQLNGTGNVTINIKGKEEITETFANVMLESAATSFQIHLQVTQDNAKDFYNASLLISPFMAALCANSPFLFGKTLWSETRIPIFEQSIRMDSYNRLEGRAARRVTLGNGYVKDSIFELFLDNIDGYPVLLPAVMDDPEEQLSHLKLHNGTIWRWNRPIIGIDSNGSPHLRIEHRVPSAGPTLSDMIANMAFYLGAVHYLAPKVNEYIKKIDFESCRQNFYHACRTGLDAVCIWPGGEKILKDILLNDLFPNAFKTLQEQGLDKTELEHYFNNILRNKVANGQTASSWQRNYINTHGANFNELLEKYYEYQEQDIPVWRWKI